MLPKQSAPKLAACGAHLLTVLTVIAVCVAASFELYSRSNAAYQCEMTYMHPSYNQINTTSQLQRYRLFRYQDMGPTALWPGSESNMIPVLFLPGNAGSYRQVRSLAGETARQGARQFEIGARQLQWFSADFDEEHSALDGTIAEQHVNFAMDCIRRLETQHAAQSPNSTFQIIVVGHSMGGVVARAAVAQLADSWRTLSESPVLAVMTLATPHSRSPAHLQPALSVHYRRLASLPPLAVPLLSVAGGSADTQVPSILTRLPATAATRAVHVDSQQIPGIWATADHRAVVWCNQIVTLLAQLLLDVPQTAATAAQGVSSAVSKTQQADAVHALIRRRLHLELLPPHAMLFPDQAELQAQVQGTAVRAPNGAVTSASACNIGLPSSHHGAEQIHDAQLVITAPANQSVERVERGWWQWAPPLSLDNRGDTVMAITISGVAPCRGFRVFQGAGGLSGTSSNIAQHEVTHLAAPLPLTSAARYTVQDSREWQQVMAGRDYLSQSTWLLLLPIIDKHSLLLWLDVDSAPHGQVFGQVQADPVAQQLRLFRPSTVPIGHPSVTRLQLKSSHLWIPLRLEAASDGQTGSGYAPGCTTPVLIVAGGPPSSHPVISSLSTLRLWQHMSRDYAVLVSDVRCHTTVRLHIDVLAATTAVLHEWLFLLPPLGVAACLSRYACVSGRGPRSTAAAAVLAPLVAIAFLVKLGHAVLERVGRSYDNDNSSNHAISSSVGFDRPSLLAVALLTIVAACLIDCSQYLASQTLAACQSLTSSLPYRSRSEGTARDVQPRGGHTGGTVSGMPHHAANTFWRTSLHAAISASRTPFLRALLAGGLPLLHPVFGLLLAVAGLCLNAQPSKAEALHLQHAKGTTTAQASLVAAYFCGLIIFLPSFLARLGQHACKWLTLSPLWDVVLVLPTAYIGTTRLQCRTARTSLRSRATAVAAGCCACAITVTTVQWTLAAAEVTLASLAVTSCTLILTSKEGRCKAS